MSRELACDALWCCARPATVRSLAGRRGPPLAATRSSCRTSGGWPPWHSCSCSTVAGAHVGRLELPTLFAGSSACRCISAVQSLQSHFLVISEESRVQPSPSRASHHPTAALLTSMPLPLPALVPSHLTDCIPVHEWQSNMQCIGMHRWKFGNQGFQKWQLFTGALLALWLLLQESWRCTQVLSSAGA